MNNACLSIIELIKNGYGIFGDERIREILNNYFIDDEIIFISKTNKIKVICDYNIEIIEFDKYKNKSIIFDFVFDSIFRNDGNNYFINVEYTKFWFNGFNQIKKREVLCDIVFYKSNFKDEIIDYLMREYFFDVFDWRYLLKLIKKYRKSGYFLEYELSKWFDAYFKYGDMKTIDTIFEQIHKNDVLYLIQSAYLRDDNNIKTFLKMLFKYKNFKFNKKDREKINPLFFVI